MENLTRVQLCEKLYRYYLKRNVTPIGSNRLLTLREFTKRYLKGCGAIRRGFKKGELINLLKMEIERNGEL